MGMTQIKERGNNQILGDWNGPVTGCPIGGNKKKRETGYVELGVNRTD